MKNPKYMKKLLLFLLGIIIFFFFSPILNAQVMDNYKKQWEEVDKNLSKSLPQSALKIIDDINADAVKNSNQDQILKCDIYYLKTKQLFEEDYFETLIVKMENDIKTAPFPNSALLHSMLGDLYWQYYNAKRWEIDNRTEISNFVPDDIKTWTVENIVDKCINHYNQSLIKIEELKKFKPDFYDEIIKKGTKPNDLRPTLYDFLAIRAITFYSNPEASITRPADYFQIIDPKFYSDIATFSNIDIKSTDTLSLHYHGIKVLQAWLKFRLADPSNIDALIDADLIRLDYVNNFSVVPDDQNLYLEALKRIVDKNPNAKQTAYAKLKIAQFYYNNASKYNHTKITSIIYKPYFVIAKNLLEGLIKQYSDNQEIKGQAQNILIDIASKNLSFVNEEVYIPNKPINILFNYKNINKIYVELRRIDKSDYDKIIEKSYDQDIQIKELRSKNNIVKTYTINLKTEEDYQNHTTEFLIDGFASGGYVIISSNSEDFEKGNSIVNNNFIQISNLSFISQQQTDGSILCYVLNRENSEPIVNAKIKAYYSEYNYKLSKYVKTQLGTYKTDEQGKTIISSKSDNWVTLSFNIFTDNDSLFIDNGASIYKINPSIAQKTTTVQLFTDRKLYRPGQTVYFKGIVIEQFDKARKILPKTNIIVTFYDVNWQKINSTNFTSNDFGSFNGSFVIPQGLLNGSMTLQTSYGSTNIQVEEYKRPTFEVELQSPKEQYLVNQQIKVPGNAKNYSGANLTDAQIQYTVYRKSLWFGWWLWDFNTNEVLIARGVSKTNDKGEFEIDFQAIPDLEMPKNENTAFNYSISVDVTDLNGETQSTSSNVVVGYTAMKLSSDFPTQISLEQLKDKKDLKISPENLNGQAVDAKGTIEISSLETPKFALNKKYWTYADEPLYSEDEWTSNNPGNEYKQESDFRFWTEKSVVWQADFNTSANSEIDIKNLDKLKPGIYKIKLKSKDAFGNDVNSVEFFQLFEEKNATIPYPTNDWALNLNSSIEPGNNAKFIVGSSDKTQIIMQISRGDKILDTKYIKLNKEQKIIEYPVTEDLRGGFNVSIINICQNRTYSKNFYVFVPFTNKQLDIEFATFRDKLQPGQKEQWKLIIKDKSGDAALSELMTFMYDASLDALFPYYFGFSPYNNNYSSYYWTAKTFESESSRTYNSINYSYSGYNSLYYSSLNWFDFYYHEMYLYDKMYRKSEGVKVSSLGIMKDELQAPVAESKVIDDEKTVQKEKGGLLSEKDQTNKDVQIRQNFNETAFFYPDLQTDSLGNLVISFTMPESLTKWRFIGLAHTKDLKYGIFDKFVVTQKELMVMPNAPRFFRQGDTMFFAAKISNLSDKKLSGNVSLEFVDEISGKTVDNIIVGKTTKQNFSVEIGQNIGVKWQIIIPDDAKLLTYRIIAQAENFSDGEQKTIPVMTNRILVTEALPLPIRANQTKTFKFDKLINSGNSTTLKTDKLTLEFTSNPAWYAVQALPYLIEYPYECNEQTFARLYANTLASYIANSSPKIKAVFDTWKNYQPSALMSNLEKNQELKALLLQETPWVLNAQDENQRKHNVALLFDLNRMANEKQKALKKLKKEQTLNGGWSWFPGMPESWWITQYIAEGIGHLMKLNVVSKDDADFYNMAKNAIAFTDSQMLKEYKYILKYYTPKQMKENRVSQLIIHYFYTRSFFDIPVDTKNKEAYNYFYEQMKKYWTEYSLYSQGMMTLAFNRFNDENLAKLIVKSLTERALHHEELGMYWKNNISGYYWYQDPIQTQAIMIEVFDEVAKSKNDVDELKIWLLKNKQTNDWKTTTATAEAIYSLLLTGGVDLLANSQICQVSLGNITIDPTNNPDIQTEAGTGYYKVSFDGSEVTPDMGNVKVINNNDIVAWGALYWQYFEDLDKITPHETPLKLKKDLFKEITSDRGTQLIPLDNKADLKIGDKVIVRIELRVDRDMEYVHMKDMRAAAFEPINIISRYKWQDGLGYYETTKDASTNFFFSFLPKGTYVFEYPLRVSAEGSFSNGITTIQCMYAPEFMSHSQGQRVKIK